MSALPSPLIPLNGNFPQTPPEYHQFLALLRQDEHYRNPASYAPGVHHHAVFDEEVRVGHFETSWLVFAANGLPVGNSDDTAESCDSESSCSELFWSSFPADILEDDQNAVLGEIWYTFRKCRREWRDLAENLPRNRFGQRRLLKRSVSRRHPCIETWSGKGNSGVKRSGNPKGKDDKPFRCRICGSEAHLQTRAPAPNDRYPPSSK